MDVFVIEKFKKINKKQIKRIEDQQKRMFSIEKIWVGLRVTFVTIQFSVEVEEQRMSEGLF